MSSIGISYMSSETSPKVNNHDDVIKRKHFPPYWPFVRGIHRSPVDCTHKGQWHGALLFSLICAWINGWTNNREAGYLRCHRTHYAITAMIMTNIGHQKWKSIMPEGHYFSWLQKIYRFTICGWYHQRSCHVGNGIDKTRLPRGALP